MSSRKRWQNKASYCKKGVAGKITNGGHSLKTTRAAGSRAVGQGWVGVGLGGIAGIKRQMLRRLIMMQRAWPEP